MNAEFVSDLRNQYITEHGPNSLGGLIFHDTSLEVSFLVLLRTSDLT